MKAFYGELIGTFLLVFIGLSTVANAVIIEAYTGLFQVAALWGIGLSIAIIITGPLSGAHLNPAITLSFATHTPFPWKKVPSYILAQCLGAFLASVLVYLFFNNALLSYEVEHGLSRGSIESVRSAMVFGEFFPNPAAGSSALKNTGLWEAFLAESVGTALLAYVIFSLIRMKDLPSWLLPFLIGGTLTLLISLLAPLSMAGFNPARDLIPRAFSSVVGWGSVPFSYNGSGWFLVYLLAPILGAQVGSFLAQKQPLP